MKTYSFAWLFAITIVAISVACSELKRFKRDGDDGDGGGGGEEEDAPAGDEQGEDPEAGDDVPVEGEEGEIPSEGEETGVVVATPLGSVRGTEYENAINGELFIAFLGIPFAEPPVGNLRFMPPKPKEPWEGILDATNEAEICLQMDVVTQSPKGSEDCLKLSVFTPKYPEEVQESPLPVIVYVHGGAFLAGAYRMESGPDYLLTQDIILVCISYRLALFGFLSLQDDLVPGNNGLKDQVLALKWVRDNIAPFGGDPKKVTLLGLSAGAVAVHMHTLSPLSRGLFHGAIASSGTAIVPWAIERNPRLIAEILGDVYNCSRAGNAALLKCFQDVEALDFAVGQFNAIPFELVETRGSDIFFLIPCIEPKNTKEAFLPDEPYEILARGEAADVPLILGITADEQSTLESFLTLSMAPLAARKKALKYFEGVPYRFTSMKPFVATKRMMDDAMKLYYGGQKLSFDNLDSLVKIASDLNYELSMHDSAVLHFLHAKSPVYEYMATLDTNYSFVRQLFFFAPPKGVSHGDFTNSYIFYSSKNDPNPEHEGQKMALRSVKAWANFARTGNPTPDDSLGLRWLPFDLDHRYYLNMGEKFKLEEKMHKERMEFWDRVRKRENFDIVKDGKRN